LRFLWVSFYDFPSSLECLPSSFSSALCLAIVTYEGYVNPLKVAFVAFNLGSIACSSLKTFSNPQILILNNVSHSPENRLVPLYYSLSFVEFTFYSIISLRFCDKNC